MRIKRPNYFHQEVRIIIQNNLNDPDFDIITLSRLMGISRSQLYRKIKKKTGISTASYIRQIRLQASKELLQTTDWSIANIAKAVGFNSASYFTSSFKEAFGHSPKKCRNAGSDIATNNLD